ncbi:MAG: phosphatidylglycerophosphatase A [Betaproteobacteria bacterium RIFCSPLOWO2_02_FULL_68_150]|nr:MAG: phosphatidylglycerophosphatase A [Betaproteobacteria bacterium RIFCSPLOWO2_02_FULL_68_150]
MIARHPGLGFAYAHPAHFIALGFGAGASPLAPGTVGTLVAFPLWWLLGPGYSPLEAFAVIVLLFGVGVWACELTGRHLGVPDHGAMCWDEVVAFLGVLAVVPNEAGWQLAAFFLFRAFDVVKPPPIRGFERRVKGGLGVMLDDVLAAGYTLLTLAIVKRIAA